VGRTQRLVTPAIRKALTLRDGGCIFPGCNAFDTRCEAHHLTPWWDGGATALHNLVLLCPFHHKLVEPDKYRKPEDRWVIHTDHHTSQPVITAPGRTDAFCAIANPSSSLDHGSGDSSLEPFEGLAGLLVRAGP